MSNYDDDEFEVESQFILRAPNEEVADSIEKLFLAGKNELENSLKISFEADMRNAHVHFQDQKFEAKLLDLPCIVESYKTFDKNTFYKTGDISQILICESAQTSNAAKDTKVSTHVEKRFEFPDGLTPPMKNVRERRFRKLTQQKPFDYTEVEKEVRRLFRADSEAVKVSWQLITEEVTDGSQPVTLSLENNVEHNSNEDDQIYEANYLFGDLSDLDEEEEDEAATPITHNPPSVVDNSTSFPSPENSNQSDHESNNAFGQDFSNDDVSKSSFDALPVSEPEVLPERKENEKQQAPAEQETIIDTPRSQILNSLSNIRAMRINAEKHVTKLDNPMLKARILENIRNLRNEEQEKLLQLKKLDEEEAQMDTSSS